MIVGSDREIQQAGVIGTIGSPDPIGRIWHRLQSIPTQITAA